MDITKKMKKYTLSTISVSIILFFALPFGSFSQDGSLDNTFGVNGIVTTSFGPYTQARVLDLAIQADGKIVVIGLFTTVGLNSFEYRIIRYNANGSLDNSFGNAGIVNPSYGMSPGLSRNHLKIQADGKILVQDSQNLARYNTNGSLDITFGSAGIITCNLKDFAIQADGKIVITSSESFSQTTYGAWSIKRYNTNGTLDTTFGIDGDAAITPTPTTEYGYLTNLSIQTDGKIIVNGYQATNQSFILSRFNTNGSLDNTFGVNGIIYYDGYIGYDRDLVLAIQADGKILSIVGVDELLPAQKIARFNTNGILNNTFGNFGVITPQVESGGCGPVSDGADLCLQTDGKIVVVGHSNNNGQDDFTLNRFNTNGSLDITFGVAGIINTSIETASYANAVAIQADGKIVVAGRSIDGSGDVFQSVYTIVRYNNNSTGDISESNISSQISIYPNPFSNATTLKTNNLFENATFIVYNTLGEQVSKIDNISGQTFTFYRENLEQGIYFYQLKENNIIVSENRFVITD